MHALQMIRDYAFVQNALIAGVAVGTVCSLLSVVVVLKRMAFIGEGVAHAGFGGIGTAIFLGLVGTQASGGGGGGWGMDAVVLAFCLATALGIGVLSRRRHVEPDSAIGILLVAAMAWGVLMSDLRRMWGHSGWYVAWFGQPAPPPNLETLLFGSLLSVGPREAVVAVVAAVLIVAVLALLFKEVVFYAFDEQASAVFGVRARLIHYLLLALLAVAIVVTVRLAGIVLVSALLVAPGATAVLVSRRLVVVLATAWGVGMAGVVGGMLVSLQVGGVSSGPCIVLVLCALFGVALLVKGRGWRGRGMGRTA